MRRRAWGSLKPHKDTKYSQSPPSRCTLAPGCALALHESPNSVHAAIDMAHAYMHRALDQMLYQSPPQFGIKHESKNMQNTKAAFARKSTPTKSQSAMQ